MKTVKSHILKLQGKAELPQDVEIGHNYHVSLSGSVTTMMESDNEDGTFNRVYTFRPVKVELLDPKGETLQLKDTRSRSQLFRGRVWSIWKDAPTSLSFEDYYDKLMGSLIEFAPEIIQMYGLQQI